LYILRAYYLLCYCFSPAYRQEAHERWENSKVDFVSEVGGGILGLVVSLAVILLLINMIFY
jgi:hypothetical protein